MKRLCVPVLALFALFSAPSAFAIGSSGVAVVDDFEVHEFALGPSSPDTDILLQAIAPPYAGHVIGPTRKITVYHSVLAAPGAWPKAVLQTGYSVNDRAYLDIWEDTSVTFEYQYPTPLDFTGCGFLTTLNIEIPEAAAGNNQVDMTITFTDSANDYHVDTQTIADGVPALAISLSQFTNVDMSKITNFSVRFHQGISEYPRGQRWLGDMRLTGTGSIRTEFIERVITAQVPPLPGPPVEFEVWDVFGMQLYDAGIGIVQAISNGMNPQMSMEWSYDFMEDGQICFMDLKWDDAAPFSTTNMAFSVQVGGDYGLFPELYPPDPVHGDKGILLAFPVGLRDSPGGNLVGKSTVWLTIDVVEGQGIELQNVSLSSNPMASGCVTEFAIGVDLVETGGGVDTQLPIMNFSWWSDWNTSVLSAGPTETASRVSLLTAMPSVMRSGTMFQAAEPLSASGELTIYDVQGRRVRTLNFQPGDRGVHWDGRDRNGSSVPAGLYFAKAEGQSSSTTRVVKLR